ncbi:MAG: RNA methyltransferase [Methylophilaceae bacterium]|uniref:RNA methyltransferase n=1 Tax=Methylovorus sp. MM2 TaxID=1848038 RepID=UPI0007E1084F|nr:RNA methyltransferase [Methylovorus sp. MM2]OAM52557.1 tRNA (cytosine(32)/uridine(32)-2'-O)-methyltransferase TrmJ [Methylovorus sp. MM2]
MTSKSESLNNIRIVLCQPSHPGNIGSAARAMKTMGISQLCLVAPEKFPHDEANALACGAVDLLENAQIFNSLEEALTGCTLVIGLSARKRQLSHELVQIHEAANRAWNIAQDQKVALVFGTEMSGLSNAELDLCQLLAMIPTNPDFSSLNLAAAVQVVCYELRMASLQDAASTIAAAPMPLATSDDTEGLYRHLEETLVKIGFLNPAEPKRLMQRIRRMYARTKLEKEEVNILRGILTLTQHPRPPENK